MDSGGQMPGSLRAEDASHAACPRRTPAARLPRGATAAATLCAGNADLDMWAPHVRKVKNYCLTKVVTLGDDDDKKEGTQQLLEAVAQLSAKVDALAAQQGGSKPPGNPR